MEPTDPKSNIVLLIDNLMIEMELWNDRRLAPLQALYQREQARLKEGLFTANYEGAMKAFGYVENHFPEIYRSIQNFPVKMLDVSGMNIIQKIKKADSKYSISKGDLSPGLNLYLSFGGDIVPDLLAPIGQFVAGFASFVFEYEHAGENLRSVYNSQFDGQVHPDALLYRYLGPLLNQLRLGPLTRALDSLLADGNFPFIFEMKYPENMGANPNHADRTLIIPQNGMFLDIKLRRDGLIIKEPAYSRENPNKWEHSELKNAFDGIASKINQQNYIQTPLPIERFNGVPR